MEKHAYLIMAHHQFALLETLLGLLDDPRNDIYLHIDRKAEGFEPERLRRAAGHSTLVLTERKDVRWGSLRQIDCELLLLKAALASPAADDYSYLHLLSGVDLPLKTQAEIHAFCAAHSGREFVDFERLAMEESRLDRVRYYYLFRGTRHLALRILSRGFVEVQKLLRTSRIKKSPLLFQKGANWFSITAAFGRYVLSQEEVVRKVFSHTYCGDEMFLQTLLESSPFREARWDGTGGTACNLREIDWQRGAPWVYRGGDEARLTRSENLFARKFDGEKYPEPVAALAALIQGKQDCDKTGTPTRNDDGGR